MYTNIIGTFQFENGRITGEKPHTRQEILEGIEVSEGATASMLESLKDKKYLARFREANLIITRKRIADSVNPDNLVMQTVSTIEELDKIANMMAKRLREWYGLTNPEFSHSLENHERFVELILRKNRTELLREAGTNEKETMGKELSKEDNDAMMELAKSLKQIYTLRKQETDYVGTLMKKDYPNITALCGATIGAKLLSIAGSLRRIAMFPASTIQLLGAEKALFRHITTGAKPPKFGVIINHPIITRVKKDQKGKVARALADKISLAAKIDFFKGEFIGDKLRKEIEERFA
jgi:nucleolar protein 56